MERAKHSGKIEKTSTSEADPFSTDIRQMIERGMLALTSVDVIRHKVIEMVQKHSAELPFLGDEVSEFFLDICDLMVSGNLRKMDPNLFKIYLVAMAYRENSEKNLLEDAGALAALTGISDNLALGNALEVLRKDGYIDSNNNPANYTKKRPRKNGSSNGLLDRF